MRPRVAAPLLPGRRQLDRRAGVGPRSGIHGPSRNLRRRVLMGGPAPHRPDVGRGRRGMPGGLAGRQALHRPVQRSREPQHAVARRQTLVQPRAAAAAAAADRRGDGAGGSQGGRARGAPRTSPRVRPRVVRL